MIGGGGVCVVPNDATCVREMFLIVTNFNDSAGNDHYGLFFFKSLNRF